MPRVDCRVSAVANTTTAGSLTSNLPKPCSSTQGFGRFLADDTQSGYRECGTEPRIPRFAHRFGRDAISARKPERQKDWPLLSPDGNLQVVDK